MDEQELSTSAWPPSCVLTSAQSDNILRAHDQEQPLPLDRTTNMMAYSRLHTQVNLARYPGKVRSIGSAALHICFTVAYPGIYASVEGRRVHIWDIAGAHAVIRSLGWTLSYLGGGAVTYEGMIEGQPARDLVISGRSEHVEALRTVLM